MSDNNLAGDLIKEMQQNNHPSVFSIDSQGNQSGTAVGQPNPMGSQWGTPMNMAYGGQMGGQMPPMNGQPGQQGQQGAQMNPDLPRAFMQILQQSPQHLSMFQDPQVLQQALQNPGTMMNVISQFQQMQQQQAQLQQQQQAQMQMMQTQSESPPEADVESQPEDEEDEEDIDTSMESFRGPVQYDEDMGEVEIKENKPEETTFWSQLLNDLKSSLIPTILFVGLLLLSQQQSFLDLIVRVIPRAESSSVIMTTILAVLFFILIFTTKKIIE